MTTMTDIRKRTIAQMRLSLDTLRNVLQGVGTTDAHTLRDPNDGEKGWTVTEVTCHLRDFDGFFQHRAHMMLEQDMPQLPAYDHEAIAIERAYNQQELAEALAALQASRERFVALFRELSDEQWERAGTHPERGHFTLTDAAMQVVSHDLIHLEQITRILAQRA